MPQIPAGRSYRIKNKRSNLYMNVAAYSDDEGMELQLWHLQPASDINRRSQIWHVFPLDYGKYLLAHKASGQVVNVARNSTDPGWHLQQYPIQPLSSHPSQQWMLDDVGGGAVGIINDKSQLLATPRGWDSTPGTPLEQWTRADESHATAQ